MKFHSSISKAFGRNEKMEKEGIRLEIPNPFGEKTMVFIIARAGGSNDKYQTALSKEMAGFSNLSLFDNLPTEQRRKIWQKIFMDSVILGWEGILDEKGNDVPFTKDNALEFFATFPEIWEEVFSQSRNFGNFKEKVGSTVKN